MLQRFPLSPDVLCQVARGKALASSYTLSARYALRETLYDLEILFHPMSTIFYFKGISSFPCAPLSAFLLKLSGVLYHFPFAPVNRFFFSFLVFASLCLSFVASAYRAPCCHPYCRRRANLKNTGTTFFWHGDKLLKRLKKINWHSTRGKNQGVYQGSMIGA